MRGGRVFRGVLAVVGAAAGAMTLMACYGLPPCDGKGADGGDSRGGECYPAVQVDAGTTDAGTPDAGKPDGG
jgi:hypothetical protein